MKLKFLLFSMLLSVGVVAQDTIRTLIITESRMSGGPQNYLEITNMGDKAVQLSQFELGFLSPWAPVPPPQFQNSNNNFIMLPEKLLQPGESFVIAARNEFGPKQFAKGLAGFDERYTKTDVIAAASLIMDRQEPEGGPGTEDLITPNWQVLEEYTGRGCWFLEQHLSETDSVVVDQVGGVFDGSNGNNVNREPLSYSVAGMANATGGAVLIRKFIVKNGNIDFANARGVGEDDSEWIPIWHNGSVWRSAWWTVGNHGNYKLDENTLESEAIDVDFANKTMTVPFGVMRQDDIMNYFKKKPGIAWEYIYNSSTEDSTYQSVRTGDKLKIIVCGERAYTATFDLIAAPADQTANMVIPRDNIDPEGWWRAHLQQGPESLGGGWPRVTRHGTGLDSIWGIRGGIPYATRIDSLLERLEKAPKANWEIVTVDGVARPDLKNGDLLKITAENGNIKEHFISVLPLRSNNNAFLSSITFPDLPKEYQGTFGWVGDTIPGFGSLVNNYRVQVPVDVDGIPALVAKTQDSNAKVHVKRAANINGTQQDRTIVFTVTAPDDTTFNVYTVELVKEKNPENIQPYSGDPFVSELIFSEQWANGFVEIANPGNQPLDLSDYMIMFLWGSNPADVITWYAETDAWNNRYVKYVPGYKWVGQSQWAVTPAILEQDLNVNSIVLPGDVFCMGTIATDQFAQASWLPDYTWPVPAQLDVQFNNYTSPFWGTEYKNPWNEYVNPDNVARQWLGATFYMYRILNDSIKLGLKPATDPDDFELIELLGNDNSAMWVVGGVTADMVTNFMRKPDIYKGNPAFNGSFGTNLDDCEWTWTNRDYWIAQKFGWPLEILNIGNNLGQHFMNPPTHYMSTVSSVFYKVSPGYSVNESIKGMVTGTTVDGFLGNLIKADENQTLTVHGVSGAIDGGTALTNNDTLIVMSADSVNISKYILEVTEDGLSSNAVLTSGRYTITVEQEPKSASQTDEAGIGNIRGFEYGTALRTVLANINVPAGASMDVVNSKGAYVPLRMLNFDSAYVNVTVNSNIYLNVTAENGVTQIIYQLLPSVSEDDAFVLSDVYSVFQKDLFIDFVPRGTRVNAFLTNVVPVTGASMKLVDKMGNERLDGEVADDDKVIVTSANGTVSKVYYISKLATKYVPETTYLAYILSNVYAVDQVAFKVAGVDGAETVSNFLTRVTPAPGASVAVVDKDGVVKINGDINSTDNVQVTSADGKMKVFYTFGPLVSAKVVEAKDIQLYPNPTNGEINVSGLKAGYRIQVYNSVGAAVRDINVQSSIERISLKNQPSGMYMVVVMENNKILIRFKALKK